MSALTSLLDFILHIDNYLFVLIQDYGTWIYGILFLIIFVETGLVFMPLLPGDSLLFAAGSFCAGVQIDGELAQLNLIVVLSLLIIAAILGDALNFWIGQKYGQKLAQIKIGKYALLKEKHLQQTHDFFEKHGSKTIIIARFVPIVRTFAPFTAGLANMRYHVFFEVQCGWRNRMGTRAHPAGLFFWQSHDCSRKFRNSYFWNHRAFLASYVYCHSQRALY